MCSPFFYGFNSNKITISFSHITENAHIEVASLPNEEEIKIEKTHFMICWQISMPITLPICII